VLERLRSLGVEGAGLRDLLWCAMARWTLDERRRHALPGAPPGVAHYAPLPAVVGPLLA
jgi:hypothetical protein